MFSKPILFSFISRFELLSKLSQTFWFVFSLLICCLCENSFFSCKKGFSNCALSMKSANSIFVNCNNFMACCNWGVIINDWFCLIFSCCPNFISISTLNFYNYEAKKNRKILQMQNLKLTKIYDKKMT